MTKRCLLSMSPLGVLIAFVWLALDVVVAQVPTVPVATKGSSAAKDWTPPRTPWGDPDLQGIWPGMEIMGVPFERPRELGERRFLTDEEFAQREAQTRTQAAADAKEFVVERAAGVRGDGTGPPSHWGERGKPQRQTSLIVDPPDGRMPPMTPDGQKRAAAVPTSFNPGPFNDTADFSLYDRCITRGVIGSMLPVGYNTGNQIVQAPGFVVLRNEMIHETRVIPLDGRSHLSSRIPQFMGDSRGHWDGTTLVVETTNFNGRTGITGNGRNTPFSREMRIVERFTRVAPDTIQYEATLDDPQTWTRPWTVTFPLKQDPSYGMFEYACHEGNHGLRNALSGARAAEKAAEESARIKR